MGIHELHQVEPGAEIGIIRRRTPFGALIDVCALKEGVIPEEADVDAMEDARTYVATDTTHGFAKAVIAVEPLESAPKEALVAIEPLDEDAEHDVRLLRGLVEIGLSETEGVSVAVLDQECAQALPDDVIQQVGFVASKTGEFVFPPSAATQHTQPVQAQPTLL